VYTYINMYQNALSDIILRRGAPRLFPTATPGKQSGRKKSVELMIPDPFSVQWISGYALGR